MLSHPMPFDPAPCLVRVARQGAPDPYGNQAVEYRESADYATSCLYAPGWSTPNTADDLEEGRPHGDRVRLTVYLPKSFSPTESLRDALLTIVPSDDPSMARHRWRVVGDPISYPRPNTPGDYSWAVEVVEHLG